MADFKTKMHQIVCQLGLRPDPTHIVYISYIYTFCSWPLPPYYKIVLGLWFEIVICFLILIFCKVTQRRISGLLQKLLTNISLKGSENQLRTIQDIAMSLVSSFLEHRVV